MPRQEQFLKRLQDSMQDNDSRIAASVATFVERKFMEADKHTVVTGDRSMVERIAVEKHRFEAKLATGNQTTVICVDELGQATAYSELTDAVGTKYLSPTELALYAALKEILRLASELERADSY